MSNQELFAQGGAGLVGQPWLLEKAKSLSTSRPAGQGNELDFLAPTAYGICADASNCMKSSNPNSGIYKATTTRTLDLNGGSPCCNQGGMAIVQPLAPTAHSHDCGCEGGGKGALLSEDKSLTLATGNDQVLFEPTVELMPRLAVRRLTPRECERLQGFPDDYTLVEYRGKPAPDGPRYKALGNSMAAPCMRWIGERIQKTDAKHDT